MRSGERPAASPGPSSGAYPTPPGATPFGGTPRAPGAQFGGHTSGSHRPASPAGGSLAENKVVWIVLGVVALIAVIVIAVALSSGGDDSGGPSVEAGESAEQAGAAGQPDDYNDVIEAAFVGSCAVNSPQAACQCAWDQIVVDIPFDDFLAMEQRIQENPALQQDSEAFAAEFPEVATIMSGCLTSTS